MWLLSQSPGNASSTKGFQLCKKKKQPTNKTNRKNTKPQEKPQKNNKQWLFIEVFLATEGVEILQILQESEDVLSWSGERLERDKIKKGRVTFGVAFPGLGWAGLASCHSQMPLSPNATATLAQVALVAGGQGREGWLSPCHHSLSLRNLLIFGMMGSSPSPSWDSLHPQLHKLLRIRSPSPCARKGDGDWNKMECGHENWNSWAQDAPQTGFSKTGD